MSLLWFEVEVIYTSTHSIDEEDERDPLLKSIELKASGDTKYKTDVAFFNLGIDPISQLAPAYLKDGDFKKYYTIITFESGNIVTAVGKPERIYRQLEEYVKSLPQPPQEN